MKGPLLFVVGGLAVGLAFFAGRMTGGDGGGGSATTTDDADADRFERRIEELTKQLAAERARRASADPAAGRARAGRGDAADAGAPGESGEATSGAEPAAPAAAPTAAVPATFTLEGVTSAEEGSKRFMAFVDAQLARGPEGYDAILAAMGAIWNERKSVETLFGDEASATRHLYPWIRFLVEREGPVLDLSEHVFKTMAERPTTYADLPSDDILEIFAEGAGVLLPGAVDEARLTRFRGYATKMLDTPEGTQPKAVRGVRGDVERLLTRFWATPITPEQALATLKAGGVPPRDLQRLLRLVPKEEIAALDVTSYLEPLLRDGSTDAYSVLRAIPAEYVDAARVDAALLAGIDGGRATSSFAAMCLQQAGRRQWSEVRAFFERALGSSEATRATAADMLARYLPGHLRPDRTWIEDLLARGSLPEATVAVLRANYGIK